MSNTSLSSIWAKSGKDGAQQGEPLAAHTANVVARLHDFQRIYPNLHIICRTPDFWQFAFWSCVFHDFGKVAYGFQAQLRPQGQIWGQRHEVLSLAFVQWAFPEITDDWLSWIAAGVVSHHKDFSDISERYPFLPDDDAEAITLLIDDVPKDVPLVLAQWLKEDIPGWIHRWRFPGKIIVTSTSANANSDFFQNGERRVRHALNLVARIARRVKNSDGNDQERLCGIALRGVITLSDHTGSAHVKPRTIDILPNTELLAGILSAEQMFKHQLESQAAQGNTILIAPTGSGKTESALLWLQRQKKLMNGSGRMLYVLPYQASLNAMYLRLSGIFPENIGLQHSRSLQALFKTILDKGYLPRDAVRLARKERALGRLYHFGVRVLTPYQLLRAAFQLKGFEALITDCAGAHIIMDEIHAYEPKRLGMLLGFMEYLEKNWQCKFFVMSATLPSMLGKHLASCLTNTGEVRADQQLFRQFVRHRLHTINGEVDNPAIIDQIIACARNGSATLVVCNTIKRAMAVQLLLREASAGENIRVGLLHSRFNARDRLNKEKELISRMGTRNRNRDCKSGVILVATQVVEVSLDIDFDALFTEVAPMESLVQRFGRINRGRTKESCPVYVLTEPKSGQRVYDDQLIERVLALLPELEGQLVDESLISGWLDRIYEGGLYEQLESELLDAKKEFMAVCINGLTPFDSSEELNDRFDKMFDGTEVLPAQFLEEFTRLSDEDPLLGSDLLVPIRYDQLARLKKAGKIEKREYINIADVPYDSESGLMI